MWYQCPHTRHLARQGKSPEEHVGPRPQTAGRPGLKTGFTDSAREQWYDRPLEGVGEGGVRGAGQVGQAGVGQQDRGVQTLANLNSHLTS